MILHPTSKILPCPTGRHFQQRIISSTLSCHLHAQPLHPPRSKDPPGFYTEKHSTCSRAKTHLSSKEKPKIGAKMCHWHVDFQSSASCERAHGQHPARWMIQRESAALTAMLRVFQGHTHCFRSMGWREEAHYLLCSRCRTIPGITG